MITSLHAIPLIKLDKGISKIEFDEKKINKLCPPISVWDMPSPPDGRPIRAEFVKRIVPSVNLLYTPANLSRKVQLDPENSRRIKESIQTQGWLCDQYPIRVRRRRPTDPVGNEEFFVISGRHRLQAFKDLKITNIMVDVYDCNEFAEKQLAMISNKHPVSKATMEIDILTAFNKLANDGEVQRTEEYVNWYVNNQADGLSARTQGKLKKLLLQRGSYNRIRTLDTVFDDITDPKNPLYWLKTLGFPYSGRKNRENVHGIGYIADGARVKNSYMDGLAKHAAGQYVEPIWIFGYMNGNTAAKGNMDLAEYREKFMEDFAKTRVRHICETVFRNHTKITGEDYLFKREFIDNYPLRFGGFLPQALDDDDNPLEHELVDQYGNPFWIGARLKDRPKLVVPKTKKIITTNVVKLKA